MEVKVVLDINIWLDISLRPSLFPHSLQLFRALVKRSQIGFPLCGYTTLYYLLTKGANKREAMSFLTGLTQQAVEFIPFGKQELSLAQQIEVEDHEDACVASSALRAGYAMIATRNIRD